MFAEVFLAKTTRDLDKVFHYSIPAELKDKLEVGHQVRVPFGRQQAIGYVVGFVEQAEVPNVKDIIEISSSLPLFTKSSVDLARWLSQYYSSFFISALRLVMPPGTRGREKRQKVKVTIPVSVDGKVFPAEQRTTNDDTGVVTVTEIPGHKLTSAQQTAIDRINLSIDANKPEKFLLYGVTGSGKTEVYLQAIANCLKQNKGAIVMVPEISLTPQLVQRFRERFSDHAAIVHSLLTEKMRATEWERIATGQAPIVLGTRSAVFAPLKNIGAIILDEEYENTYKSDKSPRYHAREVAFKLAQLHGAVVILGSATPAVETYYHSEQKSLEVGAYTKLSLPKRIDDRPLPPVEVIDMRAEMRRKNFGVLSGRLAEEIEQALSKGEQIILFINRLGYFTFVMCRECGLTIECPKCSASLAYHSDDQQLRCGYCGFTTKAPVVCPRCQSLAIKYFGSGTQRIEQEVAKIFPAARILRYDRDSVSKRGSHEAFFQTFAEGKADVLIGTQMVAKGLDIANVTLVGVVAADTALHLPDFRSAEHTFQLLTQVAGRAGRHNLPGKVIIQTYSPEHYAIKAAAKHDYELFYQKEIANRRELNYPPFSNLISLLITGEDQRQVANIAERIGGLLAKKIPDVLGPAPAAIARLRGEWRYRILVKAHDLDKMRSAVEESLNDLVIPASVRITVDVDPMSLL